MTEQELRRKFSRLKTHFYSPKYTIWCNVIINGENKTIRGKLTEVEVNNEAKQFILTFIES